MYIKFFFYYIKTGGHIDYAVQIWAYISYSVCGGFDLSIGYSNYNILKSRRMKYNINYLPSQCNLFDPKYRRINHKMSERSWLWKLNEWIFISFGLLYDKRITKWVGILNIFPHFFTNKRHCWPEYCHKLFIHQAL